MKPLSLFRALLTSVSKLPSTITSTSPNQPVTGAQQPSINGIQVWPAYWKEQGQPWRTEPRIDTERLNELSRRCSIASDIEKGIYPFKGVKLNRADIEWLLSLPEFEREGLDVRGADLSRENLQGLPLTRLRGGLTYTEWFFGTNQERTSAAVRMEKANLAGAHLEGAIFGGAQLQGTDFHDAQLQGATFSGAQLQEANFTSANLWRAMLSMAQLDKSVFGVAQLQEANLKGAKLTEASFIGADLSRADLSETQLEKVNFNSANLERTILARSHLGRSDLRNALLKETLISDAILADKHGIGPRIVDAQWNSVNLALANWTRVIKLADELEARQETLNDKKNAKAIWGDDSIRFDNDRSAVRANRQLAVVLQAQGMNEEAARFAYRAQDLQKHVLLFQMLMPGVKIRQRLQAMWSWLFSWLLFGLAGYGYRPRRSLFWYLAVIGGFAALYGIFGSIPVFPDALVFSLTSFHGRGFFPGLGNETSLHNPLVVLAAAEAVVGLFIEISFIATFTQRFFGK